MAEVSAALQKLVQDKVAHVRSRCTDLKTAKVMVKIDDLVGLVALAICTLAVGKENVVGIVIDESAVSTTTLEKFQTFTDHVGSEILVVTDPKPGTPQAIRGAFERVQINFPNVYEEHGMWAETSADYRAFALKMAVRAYGRSKDVILSDLSQNNWLGLTVPEVTDLAAAFGLPEWDDEVAARDPSPIHFL